MEKEENGGARGCEGARCGYGYVFVTSTDMEMEMQDGEKGEDGMRKSDTRD